MNEAACLATKKCSLNGGMWFNNFHEAECVLYGGDWTTVNSWSGGSWTNGSVQKLYSWKEREWSSKNSWVSEINRWALEQRVMEGLVGALKLQVESDFVQCMYGGMIDSIEKVACVCGENREECNQDLLFGSMVKLVETTAYEEAAETAGR